MQAPKSFPFARKALVTSLLPLVAGGAQASIGGYGGYVGNRRGQGTPFPTARQVVVIDPQVKDYEKLLAGLPTEAEVIVLSGKGDGLAEMAAALQGREDIDALYVISHGEMGRLKLGDETLSSATLEQHADALGIISGALSEDGDLLLYGCRIGEGAGGRTFVEDLALVTGADVAASDDLTGAAASGGDWALEVSAGAIESALPVDAQPWQQFSGVLLADGTQDVGLNTTSNFADNGATASNGYFVISGKSGIDLAEGSFSHAYVSAQATGDYWIRVDADGANVQSFQLTSIYMGEWSAANSFLNVSVTGYLAGGGTVTMSGPESSLDTNAYDNFGAALSNTNQYLTGFRIDFTVDSGVANNWANDLALFSFDIANAQSPNAAPVFTAAGPFSIDETATVGVVVGNVDAHDGENSGADVNVTYAIQSGNPNADGDGNPAFAIDTNSGAITVNDADDLDYEDSTGSTLTIRATDDQGATTDQAVTVNLIDVAPAIAAGQSFGVNESDSNGKVLGAVVTTGDDDSVAFSIQSGNTDSAFGIDTATGQLTLTDTSKLDASVTSSYALTVRADDGNDGSQYSEQSVTVNVTDDVAPTVTTAPAGGPQPGDAAVDFTVAFEEPVTGVSADDFALTSTGSASATISVVNGSGASYTVSVGGIEGEGTLRLDLKAGTDIDDGFGNTPAAYTSGTVHTMDTVAPAVTSVNVPTDGVYGVGQALTFTVNFAEKVLVDTAGGTPSMPINLGTGGTVQATYVAGSGTTALTFAYTVQSGQADSDGITVGASIATNGGTLRDAAGNDAATTLNAVGPTAGVLVDGASPGAPLISGISTDTGSAGDGVTGDATLVFLGTAEVDSSVEVFIDGGSIGNATADGSGNWSFDHSGTPLAEGNYAVTAKATDVAGNTSGASTALNITVDTKAPVVDGGQVLSVSEAAAIGDTVGTVTATDANSVVGWTITTGNDGGVFAIDETGLITLSSPVDYETKASYALTLTAKDIAGNTSAGAAVTVNIQDAAVSIPAGQRFTVDEGAANGTVVAKVATTGDPASAFAIDGSVFAIDNSGTITVADASAIQFGSAFTPTVTADGTVSQSVSIAVTNDRDGDGLPNHWEEANGLNPDDPADAVADPDGDGLSNLDEYTAGTDPATDDQPPLVTAPADVTVNATGLFTAAQLGAASATDAKDGTIAAVDNDAPERFAPGRHTVTWSAADAAGNIGTAEQQVDVLPMVGVGPNQLTSEGSVVTVPVVLNGNAPAYPVEIPYTIGGTADASDQNLTDGTLTIYSGVEGAVTFTTTDDGLTGEPDETVVLTLGKPSGAALGLQVAHTVTIREGNVAPHVDLSVTQGAFTGNTVAADAGPVVVTALVSDANGDNATFDWSGSDSRLLDADGAADTLTFDPSGLEPGVYELGVTATDDAAVPGTGGAVDTLRVLAAAPVLSATADTDGDGIDDLVEGLGDGNGNGIPDYLDTLILRNVLPERSGNGSSYLIESPAGTSLSLGPVALGAGAQQATVPAESLAADDAVVNAGGVFDFRLGGFSSGASVEVVIPQAEAIPAQAIYRQWTASGGWTDFVQDGSNAVASAPGAPGYCPPPSSVAYTAGLTAGHWCIQLTIQDGGANDGVPAVPGYLAQTGGVGAPSANQDGAASTKPPARRNPFEGGSGALGGWALLGLLPLAFRRRRR